MYIFLLIVAIGLGGILATKGIRKGSARLLTGGAVILTATVLFFAMLSLWGEMLWFEAVGYGRRFWLELLTKLGLVLFGGVAGAFVVALLAGPVFGGPKVARVAVPGVGVLSGAVAAASHWEVVLKFWHRLSTGTRDPIFGLDVSFFLFTLPLLEALFWLLTVLLMVAGAVVLMSMLVRFVRDSESIPALLRKVGAAESHSRAWLRLAGVLALVLAWKQVLNAFNLMYSTHGVVTGPGWTDVHIRLPAHLGLAVVLLLAGGVILWTCSRRRFRDGEWPAWRSRCVWGLPVVAGMVWIVGLGIVPALAQWLYVRPNEVSVERPYIEHNIRFTRLGFRLDRIEERQFPVAEQFGKETAEGNRRVLSQVRLWDPRALDAVYEQFQEIRLYYEFTDVDIDRYTIEGDYRQVMVSPREMALDNLPSRSQTFVNRHFKYTHGHGLTMAPVNEFTGGGLPNLLVKDLPPKSVSEDLELQRPEIYYGELSSTYAVVNTEEKEFDFPRGEHNVYARYAGDGGVQLSNPWRTFVYGWKLGGTKFILSGYPTNESRVMFDRGILRRVRKLAPFLRFDRDPYVVLHEGALYWIVDAYTTSRRFPYSEEFPSRETRTNEQDLQAHWNSSSPGGYLSDSNYVRNAVKAVVNAYDGSVDFYVFDPEDPLIRVWRRVFPDLLKDEGDMPDGLRAHVRYPEDFLLVQGLVYARYHMTDPEVFYNQEDVWVRATEKYYAAVQPVEPYYVMWQPPGTDELEFILMLPFTPKHRQVLIGWLAGMCDGANYGRLLAYRFPKEKRVLGIQQVETKIDQDAYLSQQLSLWDQRGSRVVRGNVLAIPVEDTLLYVEPIYLQAEAAAYPELRLVAVMHDDRLSYAESFDEALEGLYVEAAPPGPGGPPGAEQTDFARSIQRANSAFKGYLKAMNEKNFAEAGRQLDTLSKTLEELESAHGNAGDQTP